MNSDKCPTRNIDYLMYEPFKIAKKVCADRKVSYKSYKGRYSFEIAKLKNNYTKQFTVN